MCRIVEPPCPGVSSTEKPTFLKPASKCGKPCAFFGQTAETLPIAMTKERLSHPSSTLSSLPYTMNVAGPDWAAS